MENFKKEKTKMKNTNLWKNPNNGNYQKMENVKKWKNVKLWKLPKNGKNVKLWENNVNVYIEFPRNGKIAIIW